MKNSIQKLKSFTLESLHWFLDKRHLQFLYQSNPCEVVKKVLDYFVEFSPRNTQAGTLSIYRRLSGPSLESFCCSTTTLQKAAIFFLTKNLLLLKKMLTLVSELQPQRQEHSDQWPTTKTLSESFQKKILNLCYKKTPKLYALFQLFQYSILLNERV